MGFTGKLKKNKKKSRFELLYSENLYKEVYRTIVYMSLLFP